LRSPWKPRERAMSKLSTIDSDEETLSEGSPLLAGMGVTDDSMTLHNNVGEASVRSLTPATLLVS
jgi:hypothetical protein